MRTMKNQKKRLVATTQTSDKPYIVRNAAGEEFLLPNYSESFRALMDDKEIIIDMLNGHIDILDHLGVVGDLLDQPVGNTVGIAIQKANRLDIFKRGK